MISRYHLVIMHQPYLDRVLGGTKTVESRFLSRRVAPYGQVRADDIQPPLSCPRRDRRPWVVLHPESQQSWQILLRATLMTRGVRIC